MKLHILRCGSMRVSPAVPYGNQISLGGSLRELLEPEQNRVELPVLCFLIEHPRGPILVDTGWCREISPAGVYDPKAAAAVLPRHLAAFYRPSLPAGEAIHEQLAGLGLKPEELAAVLLTHLDPDHVAGLRHLEGAMRIILPEDEYFWACRTVYKARQPWSLWMDFPMERPYYRASPLGPNHWAIDVFGDESLLLVNVPGHTDGQAAVLIRDGGRFVLLAADAAFSPRNWREEISPGFGFDRQRQLASLRWLREMAEDPACAGVFCSHDPALKPGTLVF
jgi:glyoxylase-like metal-dependent hydrolase (beta-lactamase superfamily II)